ncbi:MAG: response regulator [Flavobacterium sp.]|nr:response regulator [Flavobacterium sp.]
MLNKILFIDDDPITFMLFKKVIEKAGFAKKIDVAKNGTEAVNYFKEFIANEKLTELPNLIFLDLNMPVMGGWEFLDQFSSIDFAEKFSSLKVIVLSSTIDPYDIDKAKKYPMVLDFLSKPITVEMLNYIETIM